MSNSYVKGILKRFLILGCWVGFFCVCFVHSEFVDDLETLGIDTAALARQQSISRYEFTRLVNAVECKDCFIPAENVLQKYVDQYRREFTALPGKDFRDILWGEAFYNQDSYYYCVAYVGDINYMRGYPAATSTICAGNFCGTRSLTKAEFIQVIMNILAVYIYESYQASWSEISRRYDSLPDGSFRKRSLTQADIDIIDDGRASCTNGSCVLKSAQQLQTYLKYCMFNLQQCDMNGFVQTPEGFWPVAELNALVDQGVISDIYAQEGNINRPVRGDEVLSILASLHEKIACRFNHDYDCDGIINRLDNCPYTYNPNQSDIDRDGRGDVCDDDIDGDGIRHPLGVVDARGNVVVSLLTGSSGSAAGTTLDNCILVSNTDQQSTRLRGVGDACYEIDEGWVGLSIQSRALSTNRVELSSKLEGPAGEVQRDLGDGTIQRGRTITHTYTTSGIYLIKASAVGPKNIAFATTTVGVAQQPGDGIAGAMLQLGITTAIRFPFPVRLDAVVTGAHDQLVWTIGTGVIRLLPGETRSTLIPGPGKIGFSLQLISVQNVVAVSQGTLLIYDNEYRAAWLQSSSLVGSTNKQTTLSTVIRGFDSSDIAAITRDLGEGVPQRIQTSKNLTLNVLYQTPGRKVITQTIRLIDGDELATAMTISIAPSTQNTALRTVSLLPSRLNVGGSQDIRYVTQTNNIPTNDFLALIRRPDDLSINRFVGLDVRSALGFSFVYSFPGVHIPSVSLSLPQCQQFDASATVIYDAGPSCLELLARGTLDEYRCDLDNDVIPDICDDDIDGDGVKNLLGLIRAEPRECLYSSRDFYPVVLQEHFSKTCALDNCPATSNNNQTDLNLDGIGDVCSDMFGSGVFVFSGNSSDRDGDGIIDNVDVCQLLAETVNGVQDLDGCPELGSDNICVTKPKATIRPQCNQCPCPEADLDGDLKMGDTIRSVLVDPLRTVNQVISSPTIVE